MTQNLFHKTSFNHPPPDVIGELNILTKLSAAYKIWHEYLTNLPRHTRFTIGAKIDNLFTDCLELSLFLGYAPKEQKFSILIKLSAKFDSLKFFLKLLWEIKAIDNKKYNHLSIPFSEIGKMIGKWLKTFKNSE